MTFINGVVEGERRKDAAHSLHCQRRASIVRAGQRVLVERVLAGALATADDVRAAVDLPSGVDPRCLGAVPGMLARAGIIERDGFVVSRRPERHGSYIAAWRLADPEAGRRWLAAHTAIDAPVPDGWLFDSDATESKERRAAE